MLTFIYNNYFGILLREVKLLSIRLLRMRHLIPQLQGKLHLLCSVLFIAMIPFVGSMKTKK